MLSFLSHLDVIRLWQRALARAKINVEMTQGFSPRPKLGFGPPLSVGHSSRSEYLDADINEAISSQQLAERLNETLPDGIHVLHARRLRPGESSAAAAIQAFVYNVTVPHGLFGATVEASIATAQTRLDEFDRTETHMIERPRKGRIQHIDLRKTVSDIAISRDDPNLLISMTIDLTQGAYPKPEEVLTNIFKIDLKDIATVGIRRTDAKFRPTTGRGRPNRVL